MKISDTFDHLNAKNIVQQKQGVLNEISLVFNDPKIKIGYNRPREVKLVVSRKLNRLGWADKVRVRPGSNLTINFLKQRVGVCFQLGNIARAYADIMKLCLLGRRDVIDVGIIVVPDKPESKMLGANYAHFERLTREIDIFGEIIETPILILALSN